jgi:hypothetical protein
MADIFRRGRTYWGRAQRQNRELRRRLKTANRTIAERRFRTWLDELDATAWGEKPKRSYAEAEEKFIREHLVTLKPLFPGGAMTVTESKSLKKGTRVYWQGDAGDSGVITETSWDAVTIAWQNGQVARVYHGDMREIQQTPIKPHAV